MAFKDQQSGEISIGSRYKEFADKIKEKCGNEPLDYLVLLGDILDFSVCCYYEAYEIGRIFFQELKKDNIAKEIIYVPGNHDFDIWHTVEYQTNVANRIHNHKSARQFKMSVPGIIDDREKSSMRGFTIHNVSIQKTAGQPKYAGLFLDGITKPSMPFNFIYPNIYFITEEGTVLITHGQYLEPFWSVLGEWGLKIIGGDLDVKELKLLNMQELVGVNFPLSQMSCSALGQAGPLTKVVQKLEHELKGQNVQRVETYLDRLGNEIKPHLRGIGKLLGSIGYYFAKRAVLKALSKTETTRYRTEFIEDSNVRQRFENFYNSAVYEISEMKTKYNIDIPLPTKMIFGHTHQPIPWNSPNAPSIKLPQLPEGTSLSMFNTGGWLNKIDEYNEPKFCGAEIFFYETGKGFYSESIGYDPATALKMKTSQNL
jgi:predicted phosphodiesterase